MQKPECNNKTLRKFGIIMGVAFLLITLLIILRHKHNIRPTLIISLTFFISAFIIPVALKPIYIVWMKLAFILGWFNTHLILLLLFYLIFTLVSLAVKMFGIDLLDRKIEKDKESYWRKKESSESVLCSYKRQF